MVCTHHNKKRNCQNLLWLIIEALAQSESNCAEWTKKQCYTAFSTEYGMDYYATCSETTMGGIGECGAIESHKPAGMSLVNECLQCIREY